MKLSADILYRYKIMNRTGHTTQNMNDEKAHKAMNSKFFKRPNHLNDNLYVVQSVKVNVQHKELVIVGFFIMQYAKLHMLELHYNFFDTVCYFISLEEGEMDKDSLYLSLTYDFLADRIKLGLEDGWNENRVNNCSNNFSAKFCGNFFFDFTVKITSSTTSKNQAC